MVYVGAIVSPNESFEIKEPMRFTSAAFVEHKNCTFSWREMLAVRRSGHRDVVVCKLRHPDKSNKHHFEFDIRFDEEDLAGNPKLIEW
ncbi:hypothetical protein WJX73_003676 [Symbiochloris irregularis]|uniref:Uncharacterized protein n=1 Tax=Symbiochloris irregularis TaxID=706552 RepID=A0AAW1P0M6_9CHLO